MKKYGRELKGALILLIVAFIVVQTIIDIDYAKVKPKYKLQLIGIAQLKQDYKTLGGYIARVNDINTLNATKNVWASIWQSYFEPPAEPKPAKITTKVDSARVYTTTKVDSTKTK